MSPPGKDSASKSNGVPNINDLDLIDKPLQVGFCRFVRLPSFYMLVCSRIGYFVSPPCLSVLPKDTSDSPVYRRFKVDKWDGCAVKNALDDTVKKIMIDTYGYAESHALMDGRLIICTVACLFALFAMVCRIPAFHNS